MIFSLRSSTSDTGKSFIKPLESGNSISEAVGGKTAFDFVESNAPEDGEKLDIGRSPAIDAVADSVYEELRAGRDVRLLTHSLDEPVTNRALQDVKNRLMLEDRLTPLAAKVLMSKIRVETFQRSATA